MHVQTGVGQPRILLCSSDWLKLNTVKLSTKSCNHVFLWFKTTYHLIRLQRRTIPTKDGMKKLNQSDHLFSAEEACVPCQANAAWSVQLKQGVAEKTLVFQLFLSHYLPGLQVELIAADSEYPLIPVRISLSPCLFVLPSQPPPLFIFLFLLTLYLEPTHSY